jgi:hypothetical protein
MPRLPLEVNEVGTGNILNIGMTPTLNQLGRNNTHGTIVGGKGLIQLGHPSPDSRLFLNQVHLKSAVGQIQRGLDATNSCSHNSHGTDRLCMILLVITIHQRLQDQVVCCTHNWSVGILE